MNLLTFVMNAQSNPNYMFNNKEKAKENFQWTAIIAGAVAGIATVVATLASGAVKLLDEALKESKK